MTAAPSDPLPTPAPLAEVRKRRRWDRDFWLVTFLAACVVLPRAALICRAHNESVDDDYHLRRGLLFWTRADVDLRLNDPPLGAAIGALPMFLLDCASRGPVDARTVPPPEFVPDGPRAGMENHTMPEALRARARAGRRNVLYGQRLPPPTLYMIVGIWKAALFVPLVAIAFTWCRSLYGAASGWMAALLLVFEPNFAAMVHSPAVDVLGVATIVIACYAAWRYAQARSTKWLAATAVATALAMSVKHTALILPAVLAAYLLLDAWARGRPMLGANVWRSRVRRAMLAALIWGVAVWVMTGFDVSVPHDVGGEFARPPRDAAAWRHSFVHVVEAQLTRLLPAGTYVGSVFAGLGHNSAGHWGYLFGEHRVWGWWYYFPAVATYKAPLGIALLIALAALSLRWVKAGTGELGLAVPMLAWGALLLATHINIGFRHALPAYAFALLLATRAVAPSAPRWMRVIAWIGVAAAAVHGLSYHPNYHAYLNVPRSRAYLDISDSNVDWGQSIKPIAGWIDAHRTEIDNRPVYVRPFGDDTGLATGWYVGHRATRVPLGVDPPTTGLLIISPVHVLGLYDSEMRYAALGSIEPETIIEHTMLVYDMDKLVKSGFIWPEPVKGRLPFTDVK
ncbi:MAG: glycosyltransferase family 39 protein [Tepidisphaeraceae bacterium]